MNNFTCPRQCPLVGKHWCKFNKLFNAIGVAAVHSHTVTIKTELRDPEALRAAVEAMGGKWLGNGKHQLYQGPVNGHGFTLPEWRYPLCLSQGTLAYDDYRGAWGNVADLERLKAEYSVTKAEQAAVNLGWQCERTEQGLTVYHPGGGSIVINGQNADFTGFAGKSCHDARLALGLAGDVTDKPEVGQVVAEVQVTQ